MISLDKSCLKTVVFPPTPVGSGPAVDPRPNTVSYSWSIEARCVGSVGVRLLLGRAQNTEVEERREEWGEVGSKLTTSLDTRTNKPYERGIKTLYYINDEKLNYYISWLKSMLKKNLQPTTSLALSWACWMTQAQAVAPGPGSLWRPGKLCVREASRHLYPYILRRSCSVTEQSTLICWHRYPPPNRFFYFNFLI